MARRDEPRHRLPAGAEDLGRDLPGRGLRDAGYSAVWHGQKGFNGVAVLARGDEVERRRGLPGDPDDTHSRYLEASAHGIVVASIYLPNGNPQPGPKFDYKLAWFERLGRARGEPDRRATQRSCWPATTTSSPPTRSATSTRRARTRTTPCCSRSRAAYQAAARHRAGLDSLHPLHPGEPIYTYWDYFRNRFRATPACASITCCSTRRPRGLESAGVDKGAARARERRHR